MNRWEEFDKVAKGLKEHPYYFAKTMGGNPHYYTLRKDWKDSDFVNAVKYMREHGYKEWYYGKSYVMLNVNDQKYWTMGEPINKDGKPWTILINTKLIDAAGNAQYNYIANGYDDIFYSESCEIERENVLDEIEYTKGESVLDIGCGTGLWCDYNGVDNENYVGVDVSFKMLNEFYKKHGDVNVYNCRFEDFYIDRKFDKVVSLFGSFSFIPTEYLDKVRHYLKDGGKAYVMFYNPKSVPREFVKRDVKFPFKKMDMKYLNGWDVSNRQKYIVAEIEKGNEKDTFYAEEQMSLI